MTTKKILSEKIRNKYYLLFKKKKFQATVAKYMQLARYLQMDYIFFCPHVLVKYGKTTQNDKKKVQQTPDVLFFLTCKI